MNFIKEPQDGQVTSNGEIIWEERLYKVSNETYSEYILVTKSYTKAINTFIAYDKYLSKGL